MAIGVNVRGVGQFLPVPFGREGGTTSGGGNLPPGGTTGQVASKASNVDYDVVWVDPTGTAGPPGQGVPVGGTAGQILSKVDAVDYNTAWINAPAGGGSVDWANVPGPVTVRGTASAASVSVNDGTNSGTLGVGTNGVTLFSGAGGVVTYKDNKLSMPSAGTLMLNTSLITDNTNAGYEKIQISGNLGVKFGPGNNVPADTQLKRGAAPGQLTINGNKILVEGDVTGGGGATNLDGLTDVDTTTTPPAANNVLTYDGTIWKPAAPSGGGSVNWGNVVGPVRFNGSSVANENVVAYGTTSANAHPEVAWRNMGGSLKLAYINVSNGSAVENIRLAAAGPVLNGSRVVVQTGNLAVGTAQKGILFYAAASDDTQLLAGTTAGVLNINGKAIQVAAAAADGTEVGLQDLVNEVAALRAEVAELRAGR